MKSLKKASIASLMGIIAITAVMILGVTSCDLEPKESTIASGTVTIAPSLYGEYYAFTGNELVATFRGDGAGYPVWFKVDPADATKKIQAGTDWKLPITNSSAVGKYWIEVYDGADISKAGIITKGPSTTSGLTGDTFINVLNDVDEREFLGKWVMKGADNGNWTCGDPSGTVHNENVVITTDKFRLDSTFAGYSTVTSTNGYTTGFDDLTAANEYVEMKITKWDSVSNPGTSYDFGFKLTIDTTGSKTKGYKYYDEFYLYGKRAGTGNLIVTIHRTDGDGEFIKKAGSGTSQPPRDYVRP